MFSLLPAWWKQTHPGATVQLEEWHKAQGKHLHRCQPRVRVCPLHPLFPHLAQRACQNPVQFLPRGDCLPPLQPKTHRHHIPRAAKVPEAGLTWQDQFETWTLTGLELTHKVSQVLLLSFYFRWRYNKTLHDQYWWFLSFLYDNSWFDKEQDTH